jgi:hypothetical protein
MSAAAFAADPSGTWKWTQQARGGGGGGGNAAPRETTLVLAMKDGKLTGKLTSPGRQGGEPITTEVTNAAVKDDVVSFNVEREFNGNKMVTKYTGKLAGDTITGTMEAPGRDGGAPTPREWVAKKAAK